MSKTVLPYYKRYTRDILDGTVGMGFELKTAYAFLLDLIYHHDGKLPDESRYIAGQLECSVRKWTSLRGQLIEKGKIQINGGLLTNYRADIEVINRRKLSDNQAIKAKKPRFHGQSRQATAKQSESEPDTDITTLRSARANEVYDGLVKAAPTGVDWSHPNIVVIAEPLRWLIGKDACDFEADVLPTVRRIALGRGNRDPITSWNYFRKACFEARDERLAPNPKIKKAQNDTAKSNNATGFLGALVDEYHEHSDGERQSYGDNAAGFIEGDSSRQA